MGAWYQRIFLPLQATFPVTIFFLPDFFFLLRTGVSFMPQTGQLPGSSMTMCGCMPQVYLVFSSGSASTSASAAAAAREDPFVKEGAPEGHADQDEEHPESTRDSTRPGRYEGLADLLLEGGVGFAACWGFRHGGGSGLRGGRGLGLAVQGATSVFGGVVREGTVSMGAPTT